MSNYSRKIQKHIEKNKIEEADRLVAVAGWIDTYQHRYPTFMGLTEDPVLALVHLMEQHNISVVRAAELAEEYASSYKSTGEKDESENN